MTPKTARSMAARLRAARRTARLRDAGQLADARRAIAAASRGEG